MRSQEQNVTLTLASASTLLALITFVTPQATVNRTVASFGAGPSAAPWLLSSMALGLAVTLLPCGAVGDDFGRRRVFASGLALLGVGAAVCAAATGPLVFVLGRVAQGVGAAAVLACGLGLIAHTFPDGPGRAHATGVWGASLGGGIAIGGLLTVVVDPGSSWRVTYVVVGVLAVALAAAARLLLVESSAGTRRSPDVLGAVLLGAGLACVLGALVEGQQGWLRGQVLALVAGGLLLLTGFVVAEGRVAAPMLDLALLRRRPFLAATAGAVAHGAGGTALVAYLPTMLQTGLHRSLLAASLLTLLFAGSSVLTALTVRRLPARLSARGLLVGGLLGVAVGHVALAGVSTGSPVLRLLPGLLLGGVAYGVLNAALGREAVASVPPGRASVGSGANNTARYIASAIGISLVAVIATHGSTGGPAGMITGWNHAAVVTAAVSVAGALVIAALRPPALG